LPAKHLIKIQDKTMIEHLINRVRKAKLIEKIVLCTSTRPEDQALVEVAERAGILHFQGSEHNLLHRFLGAALHFGVKFSVIVEADEVFCDWKLMDAIIERGRRSVADYIAVRGVPIGSYLHGIRTSVLEQVSPLLDDSWATDGWERYITSTEFFSFKIEELEVNDEIFALPSVRLTLDWPDDLALIREIFARLYVPGEVFTLREVMALLHREPQLLEFNRHLIKAYDIHMATWPGLRFKQKKKSS